MHVTALVLSLITGILSFLQAGCVTLCGAIGSAVSEKAGDAHMQKTLAGSAGGGLFTMAAAIIGIVGGIFAVMHKKVGRLLLIVSGIICILSKFTGYDDAMIWGVIYLIAAVCAHLDLKKMEKSHKTPTSQATQGAAVSSVIVVSPTSSDADAESAKGKVELLVASSTSSVSEEIRCDSCGAIFPNGSAIRFCSKCGAPIEQKPAEPAKSKTEETQLPVAPNRVEPNSEESLVASSSAQVPIEQKKRNNLQILIGLLVIAGAIFFAVVIQKWGFLFNSAALIMQTQISSQNAQKSEIPNRITSSQTNTSISPINYLNRIWQAFGAADFDYNKPSEIKIPQNSISVKKIERNFSINSLYLYSYQDFDLYVIEENDKKYLMAADFKRTSQLFEEGMKRHELSSMLGAENQGPVYSYEVAESSSNYAGLLFFFEDGSPNAKVKRLIAGYYDITKDGSDYIKNTIFTKKQREVSLTGVNVNLRARPTAKSPAKILLKGKEKLWVISESTEEFETKIIQDTKAIFNGDIYKLDKGLAVVTGGSPNLWSGNEVGIYVTRSRDGKRIGIVVPTSVLENWKRKKWLKVEVESGETGWIISDYVRWDGDDESWDVMVDDE